jgi:arylsulfatase A-like enzyme
VAARARDDRPNVVLVVTDDQRAESLQSMPLVRSLLAEKGTTFSNAMVPTSRCCPSRAAILTGLFSHRTQVFDNSTDPRSRFGGWATFHRRGLEFRSLAMVLQRAGYRTGLFGKYFNGFTDATPEDHTSPGWDRMRVFQNRPASYYRYRLTDGAWRGQDPQDYSTDVLAAESRRFIRSTPSGQPLFLMYTPFAPHSPYLAAPRHAGADLDVPAVDIGSAPDEGEPAWRVHRSAAESRFAASVPLAQTRSLLAVDEAVQSLVGTLRRTDRMRDTFFVFMSDNGYLWGEHGLIGKDVPYDAALRIPLVVRWDGHVPAGRVDRRLALNLDLAGTIARVAGTEMATDGLDLLRERRRGGFVVEGTYGYAGRPAYCGWRTRRHLYVRFADGRTELFDYRRDPAEQRNLAGTGAVGGLEKRLQAKARRECVPEPPGFDW